jgi:hypothetical protein
MSGRRIIPRFIGLQIGAGKDCIGFAVKTGKSTCSGAHNRGRHSAIPGRDFRRISICDAANFHLQFIKRG